MKLGIMQPYFLPYLGYFQLMQAVDALVVYDNIQFSRKSWVHRNRMLVGGAPALFTLPLRRGSDFLDIAQRELSTDFDAQAARLLRRFDGAYGPAPHFGSTLPLLRACLRYPERNLFRFLLHALRRTAAHLGLDTPVIVSSSLAIDPSLRGADRVIATCRALGASGYVNLPGGRALYHHDHFAGHGLALEFLEPHLPAYAQFGAPHVSNLSIVDVLMFNPPPVARDLVRSGVAVP